MHHAKQLQGVMMCRQTLTLLSYCESQAQLMVTISSVVVIRQGPRVCAYVCMACVHIWHTKLTAADCFCRDLRAAVMNFQAVQAAASSSTAHTAAPAAAPAAATGVAAAATAATAAVIAAATAAAMPDAEPLVPSLADTPTWGQLHSCLAKLAAALSGSKAEQQVSQISSRGGGLLDHMEAKQVCVQPANRSLWFYPACWSQKSCCQRSEQGFAIRAVCCSYACISLLPASLQQTCAICFCQNQHNL